METEEFIKENYWIFTDKGPVHPVRDLDCPICKGRGLIYFVFNNMIEECDCVLKKISTLKSLPENEIVMFNDETSLKKGILDLE